MKMVTSRVSHKTKKNFEFTIEGLASFLTDPYVAEDIASSTCECIISTFQHVYLINHGKCLHPDNRLILLQILKGRKKIVPDTGRITGAVTRKRTLEFLDFIDKQQQLSDDLKLLFKDVAVTLYAGALRIFQLFSLCPGSFIDDKNEQDYGSVSRERETGQPLNKRLWIEILQRTRERISPQE